MKAQHVGLVQLLIQRRVECTACVIQRDHIIRELKLKVGKRTVHRVLNRAGFSWRPVPKKSKLTHTDLAKRKEWVDARLHWTGKRWAQEIGLVLDGVTLTRAPKPLTGAQKHAAQAIKAQAAS